MHMKDGTIRNSSTSNMFRSEAIERLQECFVYMQVTLMMKRRYWTG